LLVIAAALYFAVSALMLSQWPKPPDGWALQLVVGMIVTLSSFNLAFVLARKRERFVQTMTAFFATGAVFAPLLVPILGVVVPALQNADKSTSPPFALSLLGSLLGFWLLAVQVRCTRAAFEWPWGGAIAFVIGQELLGSIIYVVLFAAPAATG
jgi:Kef-type K+ transport system membrane component KefB